MLLPLVLTGSGYFPAVKPAGHVADQLPEAFLDLHQFPLLEIHATAFHSHALDELLTNVGTFYPNEGAFKTLGNRADVC